MNIKNRQQLLGLLALATVAILVGDRVAYSPLVKIWKERSERVSEFRKKVAQGSLMLDRENTIRARWARMQTNTLSPEAPVAENQVLRAMDRWSQDSRIGVTAIKPQWKRIADDYSTLECRLDGFGTLPGLTRFLFELEQDPLGLKVDLVEITARDERGEQLTLGLQVSGLQLANP